jgi:hypothetical protein
MDEVAALRASEAAQEAKESRLDVLARGLADRPYTVMVTPQMTYGTWALGRRVDANTMGFVAGPFHGLPGVGYRPESGNVLVVSVDVAEKLIERGR